jgi:long-subunit fatty acid transport protein
MRRAWISPRGGSWPLAAALAGLLLGPAGGVRAAVPPDIPLTWRPPTGVRAAGMAGACVAVADDYEALVHNPAALARVSRIELSGTVERRSPRQEVTYLNRPEVSRVTKTKIHALGFAYPFPVYRGSFVVGMAYNRAIPLDSEYFRAGAGGGVQLEQESIIEEGSVGAWTSGVAFDLSPTLSLGASGTILAGSSRRDRTFRYEEGGGPDFEITSSATTMDIDAVTGTVGALLRPFEFVRTGIVLHLPESYTLKGGITEDTQRYEVAGDTLDYRDPKPVRFEDEVRLPLRISLGLAVSPAGALTGLTVTGQADLADWTQIDYAGPIRTSDRRYAYRSVTDLRFGIEYARELASASDSRLPLRLRAGFASIPVPYRLVVTDVFRGLSDNAQFDPNRTLLSAGFGLGLDPNTMLDAAWTHTNFERSGRSSAGAVTREHVSESSILVGLTFRI